jgi:hypothetical protein
MPAAQLMQCVELGVIRTVVHDDDGANLGTDAAQSLCKFVVRVIGDDKGTNVLLT